MTIEEMVAKVEADLEGWLSKIGVVVCRVEHGTHPSLSLAATAATAGLADIIILQRRWKKMAVELVKEKGFIPDSCHSIEAMCHAMAHFLADAVNSEIEFPPGMKLSCTSFQFMPPPPAGWTPYGNVPWPDRIKFSHN